MFEPPVFLGEERLGARISDNVLINETGDEMLTVFSRDVIQVSSSRSTNR
jgi:Xaa-Pro dipeptidase